MSLIDVTLDDVASNHILEDLLKSETGRILNKSISKTTFKAMIALDQGGYISSLAVHSQKYDSLFFHSSIKLWLFVLFSKLCICLCLQMLLFREPQCYVNVARDYQITGSIPLVHDSTTVVSPCK